MFFIPHRIDVLHPRAPWMCFAIIIACVAFHFIPATRIGGVPYSVYYTDEEGQRSSITDIVERVDKDETEFSKAESAILKEIEKNPSRVRVQQSFWDGVWGIFLHDGFWHLFFNMFALYLFGCAVCSRIGQLGFLSVFLLTGIFALILQRMSSPSVVVGASGAINGIIGFFLALHPTNKVHVAFFTLFRGFVSLSVPAVVLILFWFIGDIYGAVVGGGNVAYWAHIGGFLSGFAIGILGLSTGLVQMSEFDRRTCYDIFTGKNEESYYEKQVIRRDKL